MPIEHPGVGEPRSAQRRALRRLLRSTWGQRFDNSRNDDLFYLPPEAFSNPDFQTGLRIFLSPDGKSARFFITEQGAVTRLSRSSTSNSPMDTDSAASDRRRCRRGLQV
jgi:hypothetical protein